MYGIYVPNFVCGYMHRSVYILGRFCYRFFQSSCFFETLLRITSNTTVASLRLYKKIWENLGYYLPTVT